MLNGVLALWDVADVERFCRKAIDAELKAGRSGELTPADYDDALAYVIAETWILAERFKPGTSSTFSTYAYPKCRLRFVNWLAKRFGRTGYRPLVNRYQQESLEAHTEHRAAWEEGISGGEPTNSRLGVLVDPKSNDHSANRDSDLVRLLRTRDRATPDAIDRLAPSKTPRTP